MNTDELLQILACPKCLGRLDAVPGATAGQTDGFACTACALVYPVRDQIPVMLIEEAISRQEWDQGKR